MRDDRAAIAAAGQLERARVRGADNDEDGRVASRVTPPTTPSTRDPAKSTSSNAISAAYKK